MSDPASTARTARENLARGLSALQSDPAIPPAMRDIASPIAQAMGALHQIERSNGMQLLPHANVALENVRSALGALQSQPPSVAAVGVAMEAVAASLGLVHALAKLAGPGPAAGAQPAAAPQAPAPAPAPPPQAYAAPAAAGGPHGTGPMPQAPAGRPQPMPSPGIGPAQPHFPQPSPYGQTQAMPPPGAPQAWGPPPQAASPQAAPPAPAPPQPFPVQMHPQAVRDPFAASPAPAQPRSQSSPLAATGFAFGPGAQAPVPVPMGPAGGAAGGGFVAPGAAGDVPVITADLGAQSATNFYKGLSGNDIIDHGGLFVSTYKIPKLGTQVRLKVSLPGGYEFEANAIVKWAREQSDGSDAPPGFGAQFTQITPEARQLVYRYVRNREPLFHDDL